MKHTLLLFMLLCSIIANAQVYDVYDSAVQYRYASPSFSIAADTLIARATSPADTGYESPSYVLARWYNFLSSRLSLDVPLGADMTVPMSGALSSYMSYSLLSSCSSTANWQCLGPFINTYGSTVNYGAGPCESQGRIISIWVDPLSDDTILAGADGGGLWKSTDMGNNWVNLTDGSGNNVLGLPGVYSIAVDPQNHNNIYIAL